MKVTVKNHQLNVRRAKPSVNAPIVAVLEPGKEINVDDRLFKGDRFEGNDKWLRTDAGNFCWSGGTNFMEAQRELLPVTSLDRVKFHYNNLLVLDPIFKKTKGKGVTVAIVDTGCSSHRSLTGAIAQTHNIFTNGNDVPDESLDGHGTFIAGIIAAREGPRTEVVGVAPECQLIIVKAVKDKTVHAIDILNALKLINTLAPSPDIVNLSVDFDPADLNDQFTSVINSLTGKGVILVAAGQNDTLIYSDAIFYPAKADKVFGIGAISAEHISNSQINAAIDFILPNWSYYSLEKFGNLYHNLSGSSITSAVACGALALIRAHLKANPSGSTAPQVLKASINQLDQLSFDKSLKIFRS